MTHVMQVSRRHSSLVLIESFNICQSRYRRSATVFTLVHGRNICVSATMQVEIARDACSICRAVPCPACELPLAILNYLWSILFTISLNHELLLAPRDVYMRAYTTSRSAMCSLAAWPRPTLTFIIFFDELQIVVDLPCACGSSSRMNIAFGLIGCRLELHKG